MQYLGAGDPTAVSGMGMDLWAEVLERFGEARVRVQGGSMLPAVRPGDILVVRRAHLEEFRGGDIALVRRGGRLFAHRVVAVERRAGEIQLLTKGDCLGETDPSAAAAEVLGRVRALARGQREIRLDTCAQRLRGRWLSRLSAFQDVWYLSARLLARLAPRFCS